MWLKQTQQPSSTSVEDKLAHLLSSGIALSIDELIQYQNKASLINLTAVKNIQSQMSGNYLARSKGRGMEFDEVRHYQNGDDIRAIDWRVTARTGTTHTKLFREEVERPVIIATDLSSNMLFGSQLLFKSVQAAHLAALVAWHAKIRGDRVGGIVFNEFQHSELKPRSRQQGVLHYIHTLMTCHEQTISHLQNNELTSSQSSEDKTNKQRAFEQNCLRIRQVARPGSLVYLITDGHFINQEAIRHLSNITKHCELVVCLISDPLEHQLPSSDVKLNVSITDGQQKQQLTLGDEKIAQRYHQQAQAMLNEKEQLLTKTGARLLHFCASQSLEEQLKNGVASWIR
ncbi:DUF58 domain-containing protein [Thalassotalea castellviae]|uniref:DUF58 domain-containing protein n=1 Tax=Thalassotalea castellviae TaxID=3075612 RepID=A0ABU2ZXW0_9GAMM|nr:DUF58 domain-containing protein [Thalassotalea sp. W431]MDT0602766.1 DUF58 domain-containing protein [Thalassotalea sp. W431]